MYSVHLYSVQNTQNEIKHRSTTSLKPHTCYCEGPPQTPKTALTCRGTDFWQVQCLVLGYQLWNLWVVGWGLCGSGLFWYTSHMITLVSGEFKSYILWCGRSAERASSTRTSGGCNITKNWSPVTTNQCGTSEAGIVGKAAEYQWGVYNVIIRLLWTQEVSRTNFRKKSYTRLDC